MPGHLQGRNPVTPMTGTTDEACPYCGETTGVTPTPGTSPRVKAWSCTACRTDWAITVVNPHPYFDRLAATVELAVARSVLRHVIMLADDAATLLDKELRDQLLALADRARLAQRPLAMCSDQPHRLARTGQDIEGASDEKVPRTGCAGVWPSLIEGAGIDRPPGA